MNPKNSIDMIHRKIGRNIMLFQKMEGLLKYINLHNQIASPLSLFKSTVDKNIQDVSNKTMGQLVTAHINPDNARLTDEPDVLIEPHVSIEFDMSPAYYDNKRQVLKDIVDERNDLVHHSYSSFDMSTSDSRKEIMHQLDKQKKRIQSEISDLQNITNSIDKAKNIFHNYLKTGKIGNDFNPFFSKEVQLGIILSEISRDIARKDGWASLGEAGKIIRKTVPDEMKNLKKKYGYKSLKQLLMKAGIFDLKEVPTKNESTMLFYRVKPDKIPSF